MLRMKMLVEQNRALLLHLPPNLPFIYLFLHLIMLVILKSDREGNTGGGGVSDQAAGCRISCHLIIGEQQRHTSSTPTESLSTVEGASSEGVPRPQGGGGGVGGVGRRRRSALIV